MSFNIRNTRNLIAKIELSKNLFFGKKVFIVFYITPNLHLISLEKKFSCDFPFEKNKKINLSVLENWVKENKFIIEFSTSNSHLKRQLYYHFDRPVEDNKVSKKKYHLFNHTLFKKSQNIY